MAVQQNVGPPYELSPLSGCAVGNVSDEAGSSLSAFGLDARAVGDPRYSQPFLLT